MEDLPEQGPLDVAIVIDTSYSTLDPTGFDIDGDGLVGALVERVNSDPDDSNLSAQIAAVRPLLQNTANHQIRYSIITYSGSKFTPRYKKPSRVVLKRDARIRAELTDDIAGLESVLDTVLEAGSQGTTDFYAGMRRANRSLIESDDRERPSRKIVLFLSDSPEPTHRDIDGTIIHRDSRIDFAVREALSHGIVFDTFGVSEKSEMWRTRPLGRIAGATGGIYHVIEDPLQLYCHLVGSLAAR